MQLSFDIYAHIASTLFHRAKTIKARQTKLSFGEPGSTGRTITATPHTLVHISKMPKCLLKSMQSLSGVTHRAADRGTKCAIAFLKYM